MEPNAIVSEINRLIDLTRNGKINWSSQQPNNYSILKWDRTVEGKNYSVTIQNQLMAAQPPKPGMMQVPPTTFYFFTMAKLAPAPQEILLQLNSQIEPQYKDALAMLHSEAVSSMKQNSAVILNKLLSGL